MAKKTSVTAANLAALGAERLAALLMELGEGDAAVRKRLVLALAERGGASGLIKAVDRRLVALAGAYGEISWRRQKSYAAEIDGLRSVIVQSLAPVDAPAAAERLVRLIRLAPLVLQRIEDSSDRFDDIFRTAIGDLVSVWGLIERPDHKAIATETFELIQADRYGLCEDLVAEAAPVLGADGLAALADRAEASVAQLSEASPIRGQDSARFRLLQILSDVADARSDVDAFITIQAQADGAQVDIAGIASRLIKAGRAAEALTWLDKAEGTPEPACIPDATATPLDWEHETLRVTALEQLGRRPEAQIVRWRLFEEDLSPDVLRAYLRALPDFEDDEALDRAFAHAAAHPNALMALSLLVGWPNLAAAAQLALSRIDELDGRDYSVLNAAANAFTDRQPLAATVIRRRMIDSVLDRAASGAYANAAKALAECRALDGAVDWHGSAHQSYTDYVADLRSRHGRKSGFWSLVGS